MEGNAYASSRRVPSLDGIRAVSILLVMLAHWGLTASVPLLDRLPVQLFKYFGSLGVSMFFVLSGFLITTLLVAEKQKTSTVGLKDFYIRRILRIFPAYYAYLLALAIFSAIGFIALTNRDLLMSAVYLRDYFAQATDWTNHTWSLAVEEQFYLLWPILVLLLPKRRLIDVCFGVIIISPLVRVLMYELVPGMRDQIPIMFHTRADTLLFGCLLAITRVDVLAQQVKTRLWNLGAPGFAALVLFVLSPLAYYRFHGGYLIVAGYTLDNACIALLLIWAIDHREAVVGRFLNWQPVAAVGTLSYSLYLWHVIFISPLHGTRIPFPLNVALTFATAWCSFKFIEVPFNGLRRRFGSVTVSSEPVPRGVLIEGKAEI